jgi:histone deacetylase 8
MPSNALFHALNVTLNPGLSPSSLLCLFAQIDLIKNVFSPDAVVIQCGADGLAGDPCAEWNLSIEAMGEVVGRVRDWGIKLLVLGGGGYHDANTARCWAYLTSVIVRPSSSSH